MGHPLIASCLSSSCKCTAVLTSVFTLLNVSFAIGTMTEINQLRIALQESATARNITEGQCISLKVDCLCCLRMKIEASYFFSDCFFSHCGCTCIENAYIGFKVF